MKTAIAFVSILLLASCAREEPLAPREVFRWTDQPVSFTPPTDAWYREGELSGGVKGIRFVKKNGRGQAITVGEIHAIGARNRTTAIRELLDDLETEPRHRFLRSLQMAMSRTDDVYSEHEAGVAAKVNDALSSAQQSYLNDDRETARKYIESALASAEEFNLTLEDVIEEAVAEPLHQREARHAESIKRTETKIGDDDAVSFNWTFDHDRRTYHRREIYLMHNSHLFTIRFIGLEESLPLFERVAASVEFPE